MALALDPSDPPATAGTSTASSLVVPSFSTSVAGEIIIAAIATSQPTGLITVSSVSDTSSLSWTKRAATSFNGGLNSSHVGIEVWWAYSAGTLSTDSVTFHLSGSADVAVGGCFGVTGFVGIGYPTNPWDVNVSLPVPGSSTTTSTPSVSVSTTAANTMILGFCGCSGNLGSSVGSGYTVVTSRFGTSSGSDGTDITIQYKIVSGAQTGLTDNMGSTVDGWAMIGDALSQTVGGAVHQMPSMGYG